MPDRALITLGFDGARFRDATALIATHIESGYQWPVGIWAPPLQKATMEQWEVDAVAVDAAVTEAFRRWDVWRLYADPYWWESELAAWTGRFGEKRVIEWRTNRLSQMAYALRAYHTAMVNGDVTHDGDREFAQHIANACRQETNFRDPDTGERMWVIRKDRKDSLFKIDAAMAGCLAWEARNDAIAAGVRSRSPAADPSYGTDAGSRPEMAGVRERQF